MIAIGQQEIQEWIKWTSVEVPIGAKITSIVPNPPWRSESVFSEKNGWGRSGYLFTSPQSRNVLLSSFTTELGRNPTDFAARFTALHCYYSLLCEARDLLANETFAHDSGFYDESEVQTVAAWLKDDLKLLVNLLEVNDCPDWQFVRWEILNSYLVSDWDRALKLYNRVEELELLEHSELQVLRGQFRFLAVYFCAVAPAKEDGLDSLQWEPVVYYGTLAQEKLDRVILEAAMDVFKDSRDKFVSLPPFQQEEVLRLTFRLTNPIRLMGFGMSATESDPKLNDRDRAWLRDASVDLESALEKRSDLPTAYRSILARSYFLTGHFHDAAIQYKCLLRTHPSVGAYQSLALSYRRAEEPEKAKEVLERCAATFPNEKGIHKEIAEIQKQEGNHEAAYQSLCKEVEIDPDLERELRVAIALALGKVKDDAEALSAFVNEHLKSNPPVSRLIDSLLESYWDSFGKLGDQTRDEWRTATCLLHYFPSTEPLQRQRLLEKAAQTFAKAVELELESKVFGKFRKYLHDKRLSPPVQKLSGADDLNQFAKYLQGGTEAALFFKNMITLMDRAERWQDWAKWLKENHPSLTRKDRLDLLDKIRKHRNPATHTSLPELEAEKVPFWCKDIIEAIGRQANK